MVFIAIPHQLAPQECTVEMSAFKIAFFLVLITCFIYSPVRLDKLDDLLKVHQSYCGTNIYKKVNSTSEDNSISNSSSSASDEIPSLRIVGGVAADRFEFPWQISLRRWSPTVKRWFHTCGGALIDNSFILTAAHCSLGANVTADMFRVRLGEYDYSKEEGTEVDVNVSKILSHLSFDLSTIENDINLIKLAQPLELNITSKLTPICIGKLFTESKETLESECFSTGWGRLEHQGKFPHVLQKVSVKLVAQETCHKAYEEHLNVTEGMICSGQFNAGTCSGDSGGPLSCLLSNSQSEDSIADPRWTLYGLTSFAIGCAEEKYPSVAARVAYYRQWIADTMADNL